jgi:hypothetical protein
MRFLHNEMRCGDCEMGFTWDLSAFYQFFPFWLFRPAGFNKELNIWAIASPLENSNLLLKNYKRAGVLRVSFTGDAYYSIIAS